MFVVTRRIGNLTPQIQRLGRRFQHEGPTGWPKVLTSLGFDPPTDSAPLSTGTHPPAEAPAPWFSVMMEMQEQVNQLKDRVEELEEEVQALEVGANDLLEDLEATAQGFQEDLQDTEILLKGLEATAQGAQEDLRDTEIRLVDRMRDLEVELKQELLKGTL